MTTPTLLYKPISQLKKTSILLFLFTLCALTTTSAQEKPETIEKADTTLQKASGKKVRNLVELSSKCKTLYPDRMGLSPNASLLSVFQTIPGLMTTDEANLSEKISIKIDNESHIFDVNAVLRRIRVMDVERIEIVNNPDANSGTAGVGVSVSVFLKRPTMGLHGNLALDYNTNGTIDPTMNFGWKKGKWTVRGGASLYFDRSKTTTTTTTYDWSHDIPTTTTIEELEKADSYGESVNLGVKYNPTPKDAISLKLAQDHLKVKTWITTTDTTKAETYTNNKQNSNSVSAGYDHFFKKECRFHLSATARFQNNPHLYNYQNRGNNDKKMKDANTESNTQRYYFDVSQSVPLWKGLKLQVGEKLDLSYINDLTTIKVGDNNTYYDIESTNSQTKAQIDWNVKKWQFQLGEVLDYFHYHIGFTNLPDKGNSTKTPQTYVSVSFDATPKHVIHASYRTALTRPNYKQIYPIATTIDVDNNFMLHDSLFQKLNNSKAHSFNVGHVYSGNNISVSTNVKAILMNDILNRVNNVWRNCEKNNFYRLYTSLNWSPNQFSTAISGSLNTMSFKKTEDADYENKHSFDVRWMGIVMFGNGWSAGANMQYNGAIWSTYGKMDDYVYASAHVTKTLGKWSFNACMNDIFDMQIKTETNTKNKKVKTAEERDYQGLSLGVSYKF